MPAILRGICRRVSLGSSCQTCKHSPPPPPGHLGLASSLYLPSPQLGLNFWDWGGKCPGHILSLLGHPGQSLKGGGTGNTEKGSRLRLCSCASCASSVVSSGIPDLPKGWWSTWPRDDQTPPQPLMSLCDPGQVSISLKLCFLLSKLGLTVLTLLGKLWQSSEIKNIWKLLPTIRPSSVGITLPIPFKLRVRSVPLK